MDNERDEQQQAVEALATVHAYQERTRRAARVPWWVYGAIFVLIAGTTSANDFVDLSGTKLIATLTLILLVIVLVITFAGRSAPLSRIRGVQRRQSFNPRVYGIVVIVGGVGISLISRYGSGLAQDLANTLSLPHYPNTVAGVLYGAAFTVLFALYQLLITTLQQRTNR